MADNELDIKIRVQTDGGDVIEKTAKQVGDFKVAIQQAKDDIDKLDITSKTYNKDLASLNKTIDQSNKVLVDSSKGVHSMGDAFKQVSKSVFPEFLTGIGEIQVGLDSIGIGEILLIITALIAAFGALTEFIKKDAVVAEELGQIMAGVEKVISTLAEEFVHLGDTIAHPIEAFKKLGKAFSSGKEAAKLQDELEISTAKMNATIAKQSTVLEQLKTDAKDATKTTAERQKAAQDALKIEDQITAEKIKNANDEIEAFKKATEGRTDLSKEEVKKGIELGAKLDQITADGIASKRKLQTENNKFEEDQKKEKEKSDKEAIKKQDEYNKKLDKLGEDAEQDEKQRITNEFADKLKEITGHSKKEEDLRKKLRDKRDAQIKKYEDEKKKKSREEEAKKLAEIKSNYDDIEQLNLQSNLKQTQTNLDNTKNQIDETTKKYDAEVKQAGDNKEKIVEIEKKKEADLKVLRDKEKTQIQDVADAQLKDDISKTDSKIDNITKEADAKIEAAKGDADLIKSIDADTNAKIAAANIDLANTKVKLAQDTAKKIADVGSQETADHQKQIDAQKAANEKAAKERQALEQSVLGAINDLNNLFSELQSQKRNQSQKEKEKAAKKEFEIQKGLSLVSAAISTAEGIASQFPKSPGSALSPITYAAIAANAAAGAISIATIAAKKYTPGQTSTGGSSTAPSIPNSPTPQSSSFSTLGQTQLQNTTPIAPQKVYVSEQDITSTQQKVNVIQGRAIIH